MSAAPHGDTPCDHGERPRVSIVIPCRNERRLIGKCLDSIMANDYPGDRLEVLVVEGRSEDGTREVLAEYAQRCPNIKILDNPRKHLPIALNIGITEASGDIIVRMDAHSTYKNNYVSECVRALHDY